MKTPLTRIQARLLVLLLALLVGASSLLLWKNKAHWTKPLESPKSE